MKPAMAAVLIATAFALALLAKHGFDAGALVVAGDQFTDARAVPIPVEPHSAGYDGQFYYRLALDPFTHQWTEHGIRFDYPTYRQQRIFMPLLAWIVTGGHARAIPIAIVIINIAAVGLLAFSSTKLIPDPWLSAAVWMYPAWPLSMSRDCAEIVEVALLVSMIAALPRMRALVFAIGAALTKETALLGIAAFAIGAPWLLAAITAQLGWKFALFAIWHAAPSLGAGHFVMPFTGLVRSFAQPRPFPLFTTIEIIALIGPVALGVRRLPAALMSRERRRQAAALQVLFYFALLAILDQSFWIEDWSFMRAATEYWVFGALIARNRAAVVLSIVMWCAIAGHILFVR